MNQSCNQINYCYEGNNCNCANNECLERQCCKCGDFCRLIYFSNNSKIEPPHYIKFTLKIASNLSVYKNL